MTKKEMINEIKKMKRYPDHYQLRYKMFEAFQAGELTQEDWDELYDMIDELPWGRGVA